MSALIKYTTGVVGLFFIVPWARRLPSWRARIVWIGGSGVLIAVTRSPDRGAIREVFRTLRPREGAGHTRAFEFLETVGEDEAPAEHLGLAGLGKGAQR